MWRQGKSTEEISVRFYFRLINFKLARHMEFSVVLTYHMLNVLLPIPRCRDMLIKWHQLYSPSDNDRHGLS